MDANFRTKKNEAIGIIDMFSIRTLEKQGFVNKIITL